MSNKLLKREKIFTTPGGDPGLAPRVTNLENNELKITYYEIISGTSGSLTVPTNATINEGEFGLSGNAILSKIDGSNKPTFQSPVTSGGVVVTASLNATTGTWLASGVYTDSNVALIYSIKIKTVYYNNLNYNRIIDETNLNNGYIPYVGATQDTDLGAFSLNAKSLHVKGTAGAGHLGLKHQSANITASASESSIGANSSGNPVWKNDGNPIQNILTNDNITQTITNGVTDKAPSEDVMFDALLGKQDKINGLTSGGAITIGTFGANNVRVAAAVWFISPSNYTTTIDTDFSVALSSAGLQRFVGFYGNTSNAIVKVEGVESEYANLPNTPVNTVSIGYILVTDSSAGPAPNLSAYATIDPRVLTITSSATPTIDVSLYDIVNITALSTNITSMTSGLSGVNGNFKSLIINIKDNGVARTITWGSKFSSFFAALPTTTIIGKNLAVGFRYNASTGIYNCWVYSYSI